MLDNNLEYKGNTTKPGNSLWDEYVDKRTGKSSLEIHDLKSIPMCKKGKHYYELLDGNGNVGCRSCPVGTRIVWGIEAVKDGKITKMLR